MWVKGKCYTEGLFFFFLWQILKNCNSQHISRKDEPSLHPWLFCPARIKSTAACSSNSGHLRWRTLSWPVEKKLVILEKKKIHLLKSCCLFPTQTRALLKHSGWLCHSGSKWRLYNSCKLYLLKNVQVFTPMADTYSWTSQLSTTVQIRL